jgi:hypothetical protein
MAEEKNAPDLFDLKFLPAWVKEASHENRYADFAGEESGLPDQRDRQDRDRRGGGRRDRGPRSPRGQERKREPREHERRPAMPRASQTAPRQEPAVPMPAVDVRFRPVTRVLESVLAQIKSGHLAYSVFSLARMFLDKPERYDVRLKAETAAFFQLGEDGPVARDRRVLENGAFLSERDNFYRAEVTQSEPIKGNYTSVARCRLSGILLGPTNHHAYQPQLRSLYEQRFSRRMSFADYQRQIEIVSSPEAVERWKEEVRSITTYVTLQEEPGVTFPSAAETERHFRQTYLPALIRNSAELTLDGVVSRRLPDLSLGRVIEDAWAREFRSPTKMMQELIGAFRQNGLHIFRHRKGMLFVSPIRARPFQHDSSSVSSSVAAILATLSGNPGVNRKQLLEKLPPNEAGEPDVAEKRKLAIASDLHWLISEGHVIEFNDGALDLARTKAPAPASAGTPNGSVEASVLPNESSVAPVAPGTETTPPAVDQEAAPPAETVSMVPEKSGRSESPETGEKIPAAD